jgi:hypothetical protein
VDGKKLEPKTLANFLGSLYMKHIRVFFFFFCEFL